MVSYSNFSDNNYDELQNKINDLNARFIAEINTIENESKVKLNDLQKDSEEKLKNLTDQHSTELDKIQSEKFIQIGIDPTIKNQITAKQLQITEIKDQFQKYFNTFYKGLSENRSIFKELMSFYSIDLVAYKKAKDELDLKYNQIDHDMQTEKNQIENELKQKKNQLEKELNEKQNELTILVQNLNDEFIEKTNSLKTGLYNSNSTISEMMLKLTKEKDEVMSKYDSEKKSIIESTIQYLMNLNQRDEDQFIMTKKELENSMQRLKEDHFIEKATCLSNHQEMTENEIKRFSEEMMKLRQSIQSASNDSNSILFKNKQTLSNLQIERDEFNFNFNEQMNKFSEDENEEIDKLNKKHLLENEQFNDIQTEQLNSFKNEEYGLIQNNEDEFKKRKESILLNYEKEREEYLNKVRLEYLKLNENEINEIEKEYSSLYEEQSLLLSKIEPPSSSNEFSQLTNEANDLAINRSELLRSISIQKSTLINMYENEINNENLRHEQFLNDLKNSGRKSNGRDTLRQSLRMKINEVKKEKDEENEKFKRLLNQLNIDHQHELDQLSIELNKEKNLLQKTEIESQDQISIENINSKNEIEFAENNYQKDKSTFNNEIVLLSNDYDLKMNDLKERTNQLINNFKIESDDLNNAFHNIQVNETNEKDKQTRLHLLNYSSLKNSHQKNLSEMNDILSETSASIARLNIQNRNDLEANKKENDNNISLLLSNNDKEKNELIQNKKSLSEFLDEKIGVLMQIKEKVKDKFLNRPSRDIEIEKIKKYEKHCSLLMKVLKNGLKDIIAYKKINAAKEKEYNMMFGRNPSVGVLIVGSSRSSYQYY